MFGTSGFLNPATPELIKINESVLCIKGLFNEKVL